MSKKKQEKERKKEKQDRKKRSGLGKLFRRLLLLILIGALLCVAAHMFVVFRGQSFILDLQYSDGEISAGLPAKKADCILILGAGVSGGEPSPILRERLDLGAALYRAGASDRILVSGDNGRNEYNEVQTMEDYLVDKQGIPREHIVRDHAGFCTYDSIVRAKEIFCVNSVIVVTQKYHLFRAAYIADAIGLETYGADARRTDYAGRYAREARECLARAKDFFLCILRPDPRFLGEQLPITQ
jgi:vancomycin permeability regulator SanA